MSRAFFLFGLIILLWVLAQIFFGLRLSIILIICVVVAVILCTALSHFLPVMWGGGDEKSAGKKD